MNLEEDIKKIFEELFKDYSPIEHYKNDEISCWTFRSPKSDGKRAISITTGDAGAEMIFKEMKKLLENGE